MISRLTSWLLTGMFFTAGLSAKAQLLGELVHEAFNDKIILTYMLNGLAASQRLEVSLYCSDDNYQKPLRSLTGNGIGEQVTGNGQKNIVWDVLKDREQLKGSIAFEIRGILFSDVKSTSVNAAETRTAELSLDDRKVALYADMSGALGNFIITGKDLVTAFRKVNPAVFDGDQLTLRNITSSILRYNDAFNKVNTERMGYEKQIMQYWNNEALTTDVRYMFDYALGELHAVNVLELNRTLNTINDINLGKIPRKEQKESKDKVLSDIVNNTSQLDRRLQELERRANRILYTLSNR
jgi:hypothetical protein